MANPTKYTRLTDYTPATLPDLRSDLNPEFDALVVSIDQIVEAIKDVRASDGGMVNGIVDFDALDSATQDKITNAATEAANAAASATAAASSANDAQLAQTAAETAQAAAELAQGNAEAAQTAAEAARDTAKDYRDTALAHRDDALEYATSSSKSRSEAQAAAKAAHAAVVKAPNEFAATVYANGEDWGDLAISAPFSVEEVPAVRVDLARGTDNIDLGSV